MANAVIDALQSWAGESPAAPALRGEHGEVGFGELWRRVLSVSDWLRSQDVGVATLAGDNSVEWIIADLAAWHAGVTLVPLPPFFSAAQARHATQASGARHAIACGDVAAPDSDRNGQPGPVVGIRLAPVDDPGRAPAMPAGTCKITFTSGTTGTPKGACLDTPMLEAVTRALAARIHAAPGMADALRVHFTMLPLATLLENVAGVYVPLLLGKCIAVRAGAAIGLHGSSRLDAHALVLALRAAEPQSLIVLPQILQALVAAAARGFAPPASLRFVAVGGATTPVSLLQRARTLGLPVFEGYGLSECASVVALNAPGADRPGSVGRALAHVRVRVVDGSIQVAGNVSAGYLGQPARDPAAWLDTGDLGHLDDEGFLHVTGRRGNVIISSFGRNISPEWVEAELSLCPSIAQSIVVGEARPFLAAIVVPRASADAPAIARELAAVAAGLPDYARPRRFLLSPEPFTPANGCLTDNGRPRREAIVARHAASIAALYAAASSPASPEPIHDVF